MGISCESQAHLLMPTPTLTHLQTRTPTLTHLQTLHPPSFISFMCVKIYLARSKGHYTWTNFAQKKKTVRYFLTFKTSLDRL